MSEILSLSVPEGVSAEISRLQADYGFKGRSETIRVALALLAEENKSLSKLKGRGEAVIMAVHHEKDTGKIMQRVHKEQKLHLVKSQLHYHIDEERCLEMFILSGRGREIEALLRTLKSEKGMSARLMVL